MHWKSRLVNDRRIPHHGQMMSTRCNPRFTTMGEARREGRVLAVAREAAERKAALAALEAGFVAS